jgi:hypothetical protein
MLSMPLADHLTLFLSFSLSLFLSHALSICHIYLPATCYLLSTHLSAGRVYQQEQQGLHCEQEEPGPVQEPDREDEGGKGAAREGK